MNPITSSDIRTWSLLNFARLNYPAPTPPAADPLDIEVTRAMTYVTNTTGRFLDDTEMNALGPDNMTLTEAATAMQATFAVATQLRVEQEVTQRQPSFVDDQNSNAVDIAVSGYSARRVGTKEQAPRDMLNEWPELNDALMALLTDDKLSYWQQQGRVPIAYQTPFEDTTSLHMFLPGENLMWPYRNFYYRRTDGEEF